MRKSLLGAVVLSVMSAFVLAESTIKADHPDSHTVIKGDTLWDISTQFLNTPWLWPEIWHVNTQIKNPHLIYPGDVISLVYIDGKPRLMITERNRNIKLGPKIRATPIDSVIPAIPLDKINSFLKNSRILSSEDELNRAPYVLAAAQNKVISGSGDRIYARGDFASNAAAYGLYRKGEVIIDPDTKEYLGVMAEGIGAVDVRQIDSDVATLNVTASEKEIMAGDRLLESEERRIDSTFFPSAPQQAIDGTILGISGGISQIGQFDNVLINRGEREGLEAGNVLAVNRHLVVEDSIKKDTVSLPAHKVGLLMVYRTFEKVSYAIVLETQEPLLVGDRLNNP